MNLHHCVFCRIIERNIPAYILAEDEHALACMDASPVAPGHMVVIAKPHAEMIYDTPAPVLHAVMAMAQRMAIAIHATFEPEGLAIVQRNGVAAGQTVRHFHLHVLPRSMGDELALNWHPQPSDRHVIEAAAERIRANL